MIAGSPMRQILPYRGAKQGRSRNATKRMQQVILAIVRSRHAMAGGAVRSSGERSRRTASRSMISVCSVTVRLHTLP